MSKGQEAYRFTTTGNSITAVYEVENGRTKQERMERDETWSFDGKVVTKTEFDDGRLETTTYADADGDGLFFKVGKSYSSGINPNTAAIAVGHDDDGDDGHDGNHSNHDDHGILGTSSTSNDAIVSVGPSPVVPGAAPPIVQTTDKGYKFDIANGVVTAVYEVKYGRVKADRIDQNETYSTDGADILKTERNFGEVEFSLYSDSDQNGIFNEVFEIEVNTGEKSKSLETIQFKLADGSAVTGATAAEGDVIATMQELSRYGWRNDPIYSNETLQVIEDGADNLILQAQLMLNGKIKFSVYRDDDSDGLWTQIAEGEAIDAFITLDNEIDLVGIIDAGYLQPADGVVG